MQQNQRQDKTAEATALYLLGRVASARGRFEQAMSYFRQSLHLAWEYQELLEVAGALISLAESKAAQGQGLEAVEMLALVMRQEATEERDLDEAKQLYAKLKLEVSAKALAEARGQARRLEDVVTEVLSGSYEHFVLSKDSTTAHD
jgi:tetratricopeptide (TPR) repeat protein